MKQALIVGASGGIGCAITAETERRGYAITRLSRSEDGFDITDAQSVDQHLSGLTGSFELIFVATGALQINGAQPEKALKHIDAVAMADQFAVNATGPALILRHAARLKTARRSRGINRAAKAALNQIIHTASIEIARTHPMAIVTALHPGTVATPFTADFVKADKATAPTDAAVNLLDVCENVQDTGGFFDFAGKPIQW